MNSTILKDELSLLNENRSAVIIELRNASQQLKDIQSKIVEAEQKLADIHGEIVAETTRLDDNQARVVFCKNEILKYTSEIDSLKSVSENYKVKNAQEVKLHLGRVKDLEDKKDRVSQELEALKTIHDKNYNVFSNSISDIKKKDREIQTQVGQKAKELEDIQKKIDSLNEEDKKITKERLKREDKVRIREKMVDMRDVGLDKKEEDLKTMSNDLNIIYGRLQGIYYKIDPTVDLDKLITKPD